MTTRTFVVKGAPIRHQMREWMYAHRIQWRETRDDAFATTDESTFHIEISEEGFAEVEAQLRFLAWRPSGDTLHWSDGSEVDPAELDAQG